eukprot:8687508-Heterocapsa_arctica.AAC.1
MARNEAKRKGKPNWSQSSPEAMVPVLADLIQEVNQPRRKARRLIIQFRNGDGKTGTPLERDMASGSNKPANIKKEDL